VSVHVSVCVCHDHLVATSLACAACDTGTVIFLRYAQYGSDILKDIYPIEDIVLKEVQKVTISGQS